MSTTPEMKIKALAPWFGGKRTLAPRIVAELGKHTQYFEPFCGGLSIILSKPPSQKETVNDLHGDVVNLARVVSDEAMAPKLYDRLQRAVMSETLLAEAGDRLSDESSLQLIMGHWADVPAEVRVDRAYWFFVGCWMGRNGTAGTARMDYQIAVRWTANGGSPTVRFRNAVECIPAWHDRLRNVVILRRDAFEIIDRFEDVESTVIYADPPYAQETRGEMERPSQARYLHEFQHGGGGLFSVSEDHHAKLAKSLCRYKHARIVVSAYDCPRYRDLYKGWTFVDCRMLKLLHQQNGRGARAKEAP